MDQIHPPKYYPAFFGHESYGQQPFSISKNEKNIICQTSFETFLLPIFVCLIGIMAIFLNYSNHQGPTKHIFVLIGLGLILPFIYSAFRVFNYVFKKRKVIFDGNYLNIKLMIGENSIEEIPKKTIKTFEITSEEREQTSSRFGTFRWTAYLLGAVLKNEEKLYLLEADREEVIKELKEDVEKLFGEFF